MNIDLRHGDCIEVLKTLPDNSVDSVVTDPPYGIGFMGKAWDTFQPNYVKEISDKSFDSFTKHIDSKQDNPNLKGRKKNSAIGGIAANAGTYDLSDKGKNDYQQFCYEWGKECFRVLKPGGHLIASNSPRMYHRMAIGLEDAGFEIRDQIMWVFGSGFPKSHNIGKAIDKIEGNEREVVGEMRAGKTAMGQNSGWNAHNNITEIEVTKGNSEWEGWGTALKPAHEPMVLARKPLSEKSIAENVLKHGTGGLNIDGSRIVIKEGDKTSAGHRTCNIFETEKISGGNGSPDYETHEGGRFPANIIFDEEAGQLLDEQSGISKSVKGRNDVGSSVYGGNSLLNSKTKMNNPDRGFNDKGGASRFFYCPKASKKDRNEGLEQFTPKTDRQKGHGLDRICGNCGTSMLKPEDCKCEEPDWITPPKLNHHPTVKPTDLMRYLINLITPPNGVVLDPFMGSGSTGKAAVRCGVNFIGIEKEQEYIDIARARIEYEKNKYEK